MMFRDPPPPQTSFPRRSVPEKNINEARIRDSALKHARQEKINAGKYRQQSVFGVGDIVLMRNYDKTSKYDPLFQFSPLMVTEVQNGGRCLTIQRISDGMTFKRHPDDLKPFKQHNTMQQSSNTLQHSDSATNLNEEQDAAIALQNSLHHQHSGHDDDELISFTFTQPPPNNIPPPPGFPPLPGRPVRQHIPNPRYFNDHMVNRLCV